MLHTHHIRSDDRAAFSIRSSGAMLWTNTKETSPTELLAPTPTLVFGVRGSGVIGYAGSITAPPASAKPFDAVAGEAAPTEPGGSFEATGTPSPSEGRKPGFADRPASPHAAQRPNPSQVNEKRLTPQAEASKIYLSIDSLPNLELIETIPVTVMQLGDKLFTATVNALRLSGTSSTLSESLVTVKEEIVALYERLTKNTKLDAEEKSDLKYLQSHIKPSRK